MPRHLVIGLAIAITVLGSVDGYRKFENGRQIENGIEEDATIGFNHSSPLSSRIRKLSSRYSQYYFAPFQPAVSTESRPWKTFPTSASNFFGPQSYWSQLADRLINTVGGAYTQYSTNLKKKKTERLAALQQALRLHNSTKVHQGKVGGSQQEFSGISVEGRNKLQTTTVTTTTQIELAAPPSFDESIKWLPSKVTSNDYTSTETSTILPRPSVTPIYVNPTRFPSTPPPTTSESPYAILPSLLMRDPNARSKFYHLDRVANPQVRPTAVKTTKSKILSEVHRKPAIKPAFSTPSFDFASETEFRAALRRVFSDLRKHQGIVTAITTTTEPPEFRKSLTSREEMLYARLAQLKAARANRRRHPAKSSATRRIVILPSRYDGDDDNNYWRH